MEKYTEYLTKKMPSFILRNTLLSMSSNAADFFILRRNFVCSLSTMNMTNWILGIGDRHLSNILLNSQNGKLMSVDFDSAFGLAIREFKYPELLPVRLTPQLVAVNHPMGAYGLIKQCMCHILRTMRENCDVLNAYIEVFIREPTVTWLRTIKQRSDSIHEHIDWQPKHCVQMFKSKLDGANPKEQIKIEITSGCMIK